MICKSKHNTIEDMISKKIISDSRKILDYGRFNSYNEYYTNYAKNKYGVVIPEGKYLFDKNIIQSATLRGSYVSHVLAVPNNDYFEQIDIAKSVKPGVEELFDSTPELANAVYEALGFKYLKNFDGNINLLASDIASNYDGAKKASDFIPEIQKDLQQAQQLYSQYLNSIFPDSKVKDIVYRGGNLGTKQPQDVEAFTTNKSYAEYRAEQNNTKVFPAVLNIQESKLLDKKETRTLSLDRDEFQYQDYGFTDNKDQTKQLGNFYTVKETNRHILGGKQDIEGFKEFVGKNIVDNKALENKLNELEKSGIIKRICNI